MDGAEAAYRAAIAADPGHASAHKNLGSLLLNQRKDFEGAEAAYRAAIAVNPGHVSMYQDLSSVLQQVTKYRDSNSVLCVHERHLAAVSPLPPLADHVLISVQITLQNTNNRPSKN